jgi:metal-responsive CopG/Arc/MetJ family transcriptional regulator
MGRQLVNHLQEPKPKILLTLTKNTVEACDHIKEREGFTSRVELIRQALREFLTKRGVTVQETE